VAQPGRGLARAFTVFSRPRGDIKAALIPGSLWSLQSPIADPATEVRQ
jgi:hypothetical protein